MHQKSLRFVGLPTLRKSVCTKQINCKTHRRWLFLVLDLALDGVGNGPKLSALLGRLCKARETNFLLKIRMCFWRCHLCMRCQEQLRPTLINSQGRVCLLPRRSSLLPTKESDSEIMTISIITDT